ncbi:beta-glucanosyltransferase [Ascosphaera acerosa]|nr:beta-glucanosyltransferase [Ascosphaera acerosa]
MKFSLLTLALGVSGSLANTHLAHASLHARDAASGTSSAASSESTSSGGATATYSKADVPITVKGNAFFRGKERFYIRGVYAEPAALSAKLPDAVRPFLPYANIAIDHDDSDYQPGGASKTKDPIADTEHCKRDIAEFKKLGINTVRIYSVDNTKKHDDCMKALADAGIYLVLDVNTPTYSLNRASEKDLQMSYNAVYLNSVFNIVQEFAQYDNTLAFFSGNEVINAANNSIAAPYVKAVTRDIRQFLKKRGLRRVPTGYSAADVDTNRLEMAEYMNCGSDEERSDFFAFNDYSWCDPSSFKISGWDQKVKNFTGYGLPLFLSEYGCNTNTRKFQEVAALYSTEMTSVYSGGLVYEYSQESSNYGLVEIDGDKVKELSDFDALQKAFEKTKPPTGNGGYNSTGGSNPCPAKSDNWEVDPDEDIPSTPKQALKFMEDGPATPKGFKGGSQTAGSDGGDDLEAGTAATVTGSSDSASSTGSSSADTSSSGAAPAVEIRGLGAMVAVAGAAAAVLAF